MPQIFKLLLPAVLVVSLIVACQKQDTINQPPTPKTNLAAMARTDSKDSVSYTHLDVYKRQRYGTINCRSQIQRRV